jgi:hypothetical protein
MTETDEIEAICDDILYSVLEVVVNLGLGEYGEVPDDVSHAIARALGRAVADVLARADANHAERVEN